MRLLSRVPIWVVGGITVCTILIVTMHIGGTFALRIGEFFPLAGAFIGSLLIFVSVFLPANKFVETTETWSTRERWSWALIGLGVTSWALGESVWRYYIYVGQSPFPSLADVGYTIFPLLVFVGLLMQPSEGNRWQRAVLLMDCLIAMGSILAIAWYLLLGTLAQAPGETNLAKILGLYYPISDTALLSCIIFLFLRNQNVRIFSGSRRITLLTLGIGLCFFVGSDFLFNIQQNAGTYVEATWVDLGWPIGMMLIGLAAWLRRFPPQLSEHAQQNVIERAETQGLSPMLFVPYILVGGLFSALTFNVLTTDKVQQEIRSVLVIATVSVVALIILRQIFTLRENAQLLESQVRAMARLQQVNKRLEVQAQQIADQNMELEQGIEHLKNVHAGLSNGNYRARATLTRGPLWPLAASLNLMAERWTRFGQDVLYLQRFRNALEQLIGIIERNAPIIVTDVYHEFPEITRLVSAISKQSQRTEVPAQTLDAHTSQVTVAAEGEPKRFPPLNEPFRPPTRRLLRPDNERRM